MKVAKKKKHSLIVTFSSPLVWSVYCIVLFFPPIEIIQSSLVHYTYTYTKYITFQHKAYLGYWMLVTFSIARIIGIPGLLRCCILLLILSNGVAYLDQLSEARYCISQPANGCLSYPHTYLITTLYNTDTHILSQHLNSSHSIP